MFLAIGSHGQGVCCDQWSSDHQVSQSVFYVCSTLEEEQMSIYYYIILTYPQDYEQSISQ